MTVVEHSIPELSVLDRGGQQTARYCMPIARYRFGMQYPAVCWPLSFALGENGAGLAVQRSEGRVKDQRCTSDKIMLKRRGWSENADMVVY